SDANEIIKTIDDMGGCVAGIHKGYFRRAIAEASYRFGQEMEAGDRIIVGVNAYTDGDEDHQVHILQIPHEVETNQCDRLADFKKRRDPAAVSRALDAIRAAARGNWVGGNSLSSGGTAVPAVNPRSSGSAGVSPASSPVAPVNVMPALVEGALANCTLGEMVQALADVYGRYTGGPEW
ncbi:MAG TPA: methylmalonyl-CoA mutase family protein, partial [Phycisphaerales bacterium]|nr:methylmalonyl-CoA mutase family protein [Phycisphaerales bacterium]